MIQKRILIAKMEFIENIKDKKNKESKNISIHLKNPSKVTIKNVKINYAST